MKSISTAQYRSILRVSISHCHQEHHDAPWHAETVQDHYLLKYKRLRRAARRCRIGRLLSCGQGKGWLRSIKRQNVVTHKVRFNFQGAAFECAMWRPFRRLEKEKRF
jgi:hypothetical protein